MPTNEIYQFGAEGTIADGDVLALADYLADPQRLTGHQAGIARRALANIAARQAAHMAAGLAQFIANRYDEGVVDDGDLDKVEAGLLAAIEAIVAAGVPDLTALLAHLTDTSDPHETIIALLAAANSWSAAQCYAPEALVIASGSVAWDAAAAPVAVLTLTEDVTAIALTGAQPGCSYELTVIQDATGGRTVTWPSAWRWPGGSAPDVSADAGAEDLLMLSVRSGGVIRAVVAQAFAEVS